MPSLIGGYDADHTVENIRIEGMTIGGRRIGSSDDLHLFRNEHIRDLRFER